MKELLWQSSKELFEKIIETPDGKIANWTPEGVSDETPGEIPNGRIRRIPKLSLREFFD